MTNVPASARHAGDALARVAVVALVTVITVAGMRASTHTGNAAGLGITTAKLTLLTAGPPVIVDTTPPQLTTLEMFDVDVDGIVDRVVATFDETLAAPYVAGTAGWTLTNVPSNGSLASVTVAGAQATLDITEGTGPADTAVGGFTVALASTPDGVRDAADNRSSFSATAPADKAGPVITLVTTTQSGSTAGRMQTGDQLAFTFTEGILASSLPQGTITVTEADPPGGAILDTITIPGVTSGAVSTGGTRYVNANGATATAPATVTAQVILGMPVVVVELTGCTCGSAATGVGPFVYTPPATLTDAAGNPAAGTFTTADTFMIF